ncbi:unnamed protein product [Darwinula stevensoni]|uniref:Peptidase S1 domain-containing protein n=1 Tax=Darwinula stevensoni TaxID=69355 RepID=A0A7R8XIJ6_9CRUS|nr:unnamed protein product [Darwinula stevensoni]CAG0893912.1 unnamed protein product [Darwinula stevensoni]
MGRIASVPGNLYVLLAAWTKLRVWGLGFGGSGGFGGGGDFAAGFPQTGLGFFDKSLVRCGESSHLDGFRDPGIQGVTRGYVEQRKQGLRGDFFRPPVDFESDYRAEPWMAAILKAPENTFLCSGTLISAWAVLTAATCVNGINKRFLRVRLGDWDLKDESSAEYHPTLEAPVGDVRAHPKWNPGTKAFDLAVLILEWPVDFNKYPHVRPICLPDKFDNFIGSECYVAGWNKANTMPVNELVTVSRDFGKPARTTSPFDFSGKRFGWRVGKGGGGGGGGGGEGGQGFWDFGRGGGAKFGSIPGTSNFLVSSFGEENEREKTYTFSRQSFSQVLQEARVKIVEREWCQKHLGSLQQLLYSQECAFGRDYDNACIGDVGAAIVCKQRPLAGGYGGKREARPPHLAQGTSGEDLQSFIQTSPPDFQPFLQASPPDLQPFLQTSPSDLHVQKREAVGEERLVLAGVVSMTAECPAPNAAGIGEAPLVFTRVQDQVDLIWGIVELQT